MPIYEYSCSKCGDVIEKIQKFSDPLLKKHEGCGGKLTKLISQSSFHLKGDGWYVTDYARKDSAGEGEDGDSKKEASTPDSKKDGDKKKSGSDTSDSDSSSGKQKAAKKKTKSDSKSGDKK